MTYQRTITLAVILLATAFLTALANHSEKVLPNKPFNLFPMQIEQWKGNKDTLDQEVYNILGVEDYILANYTRNKNEFVNLYVGFYQSQKQGDIIHSPKNCLPGAGWNITQTSLETIELDKNKSKIEVIKLILQKGSQKQVVLYWFQSRGRIIASEYMQKVWLVVDSITKQRTDGSFVRLISPVLQDEQTSTKLLREFINLVFPVLQEHIPS